MALIASAAEGALQVPCSALQTALQQATSAVCCRVDEHDSHVAVAAKQLAAALYSSLMQARPADEQDNLEGVLSAHSLLHLPAAEHSSAHHQAGAAAGQLAAAALYGSVMGARTAEEQGSLEEVLTAHGVQQTPAAEALNRLPQPKLASVDLRTCIDQVCKSAGRALAADWQSYNVLYVAACTAGTCSHALQLHAVSALLALNLSLPCSKQAHVAA